jgi:hypothetical protein
MPYVYAQWVCGDSMRSYLARTFLALSAGSATPQRPGMADARIKTCQAL